MLPKLNFNVRYFKLSTVVNCFLAAFKPRGNIWDLIKLKMEFNYSKAVEFMQNYTTLIAGMCDKSKELKTKAWNSDQSSSPLIHLFGSRIIGYATAESDLDIFVDIGECFYSDSNERRDKDTFEMGVKQFYAYKDWHVKAVIRKTPVPVIKATLVSKNLSCKHE